MNTQVEHNQAKRQTIPTLYKPFDESSLTMPREEIKKNLSERLELLLLDLKDPDPEIRTKAGLDIDGLQLQIRKQVDDSDTYIQVGELFLVIPEDKITEHLKKGPEFDMRSAHRAEQFSIILKENFNISPKGEFRGQRNEERIRVCVGCLTEASEYLSVTNSYHGDYSEIGRIAPFLYSFTSQGSRPSFTLICEAFVSLMSDQLDATLIEVYKKQLLSEEPLLISR